MAARRVFASGLASVGQTTRLPGAIGRAVARRIGAERRAIRGHERFAVPGLEFLERPDVAPVTAVGSLELPLPIQIPASPIAIVLSGLTALFLAALAPGLERARRAGFL